MPRIWLTSLGGALLLIAACAAPAPQAPEPTPIPLEEPVPTGQLPTDVRPERYDLRLRLDPSEETFEGEVSISVALTRPRQVIWLHGEGLDVGEATVTLEGGQPIQASWEQVDDWGVAKLSLPEVVGPGQARLDLRWSARFRKDLLGLYRGIQGPDAYVYSQFEPIHARSAFPCFDEPSHRSRFDVSVTAPGGLVAVGNTAEIDAQEVDEGWVLHRFATTEPLSTYLIHVAAGPFDVVEAPDLAPGAHRDRALPLRGITARGKGADIAWALEQVPGILAVLEDYFAMAYPFDKLDLLAVTDFAAGAMENPGAITFRDSILLVDGDAPLERRHRYVTVLAHELAHMWFGDLVTMPWWDDIWLNESFADWMEVKATDAWDPSYRAGLEKVPEVFEAMYLDSLAGARHIRQPIESNHDIISAFDPISYEKGGSVLRMFEGWMGEEVFRDGIRRHMRAHAFGNADIDDLLASLSEAAGADVATPFRTFLTQPGVPLIGVSVACGEGGASLTLEQSRYLALGTEAAAEELRWDVPVCVRFAVNGEPDQRCTLLTAQRETVSLDVDACPDWVFPNADAAGYYRWLVDPPAMARLMDAGWPQLSSAERLVVADAAEAAFFQGSLGAAETWAVLRRLTEDPDRLVAMAPVEWLEHLHDVVVPADLRPALEGLIRDAYRPVLERARALPDSVERREFETSLLKLLVLVAHDADVRAPLKAMGEALLGMGGDPAGVPAELRALAMTVAVQEDGAAAWDAATARLMEADDGTERRELLWAIGISADPVLRVRNLEMRFGGELRLNERGSLALAAAKDPANLEPIWRWHVENLEMIQEQLPPAFFMYLPYAGKGFCDAEAADEVEAVLTPVVSDAPGGPRSLANVLESIRGCAAIRSFHEADLRAWLAP